MNELIYQASVCVYSIILWSSLRTITSDDEDRWSFKRSIKILSISAIIQNVYQTMFLIVQTTNITFNLLENVRIIIFRVLHYTLNHSGQLGSFYKQEPWKVLRNYFYVSFAIQKCGFFHIWVGVRMGTKPTKKSFLTNFFFIKGGSPLLGSWYPPRGSFCPTPLLALGNNNIRSLQ